MYLKFYFENLYGISKYTVNNNIIFHEDRKLTLMRYLKNKKYMQGNTFLKLRQRPVYFDMSHDILQIIYYSLNFS